MAAPAARTRGPEQDVRPTVEVDAGSLRQGVFLDRDGVLNERRTFLVRKPGDLRLVAGAGEAVRRLNEAGYVVLVATNQPAVAWGWVPDLDAIHREMDRLLAEVGAHVDRYYACTHKASDHCACRKPGAGLLQEGATDFDLAPANCWMVGDRPTDIEAGRAFGARTVWITGSRRYPWEFRWTPEADLEAPSIVEAVDGILSQGVPR